ncbi:MAG: MBL fold metallo-hydrolase [Rhodothermaceae bacterium]|nr:MBL fold metallo-hydrolase [Rhodothermaceae bacterium]
MHYGDFEIHALPEGRFTVGFDKAFVPYAEDSPFPKATLFISVCPFLVKTPSEILLLDSGLGQWAKGRGVDFLLNGLAQHGVAREDVTKVLLSHLHFDHVGGSIVPVGAEWQPTFPNAEYVVQQNELTAPYGEESDDAREVFAPTVEDTGQLVLVEGSGFLTDDIEYVHTGGHTRDHQAFRLHTGGRMVVFGGDVLPAANQLGRRFLAKYDYDAEQSQTERSRLAEEAAEHGHLLLFYHGTDAYAAFAESAGPKGGYRIEQVEV